MRGYKLECHHGRFGLKPGVTVVAQVVSSKPTGNQNGDMLFYFRVEPLSHECKKSQLLEEVQTQPETRRTFTQRIPRSLVHNLHTEAATEHDSLFVHSIDPSQSFAQH